MPTLRINDEELDAELILFDLDGTLVDDQARYRRLAESRMKAMTRNVSKEAAETWARLEGVDPESLLVDMNGPLSKAPRREDLAVAAVALYLHGHPWHRARELSKAIYDEADEIQRRSYAPRFFPGAREAFEGLRSRGFRLGVATNGEASLTRGVLETLGALELFDVVVGADMVNEGKPAPDMILKACELAGASPEKTVYVGDQPTDARAARSAGVAYNVGVGGTELLDAGADAVVGSVSELT
ncbi:HAD family hydrolase [Candidatus Bathyarchaeota archaeon]|nr:HAD family hydrolase [Candidatus Bathyarchaeota archaeon]